MARVLVTDGISDLASDLLRESDSIEVDSLPTLPPGELLEKIGDYDALMVRSATKVTAEVIARGTKLRLIGRAGIGVDNIDVRAATDRRVVVMNAPSGNATTTAEHAIALLMSVSRHIPQATASMRAGRWDKKKLKGRQVAGKTIGIIGLGNIGRIVADRLLSLKTRVVAYDPFVTEEVAAGLGVELMALQELLSVADYITLHLPHTDKTHYLLDAAAFAAMKQGVYVINCARGGIVEEAALLDALESGKVAGAALDVYEKEPPPADHPLLSHPRVIFTPHLGASTVEAQELVAIEIATQMRDFLETGGTTNALNAPNVPGDALRVLEPYMRLGTHLGTLAGKIHTGDITGVQVCYYGALCDLDTEAITAAAICAALNCKVDPPVNDLSAPLYARENGIAVESTTCGEHPDFTKLVALELHGPLGTEVHGAVFGKWNMRVVYIDGYELELIPEGRLLVIKNEDRPGVIGAVGTRLGHDEVNVSRLVVGLREGSDEALAVWSLDAPIEEGAVEALRATPGIRAVYVLEL
ncbi:MAG: phosphoglycerate dehydrogenase [Deltaproteobacteria bacterium]|nr:phosphoglycerate dehydrogenase [Deltaproteobacteria bacterium]